MSLQNLRKVRLRSPAQSAILNGPSRPTLTPPPTPFPPEGSRSKVLSQPRVVLHQLHANWSPWRRGHPPASVTARFPGQLCPETPQSSSPSIEPSPSAAPPPTLRRMVRTPYLSPGLFCVWSHLFLLLVACCRVHAG